MKYILNGVVFLSVKCCRSSHCNLLTVNTRVQSEVNAIKWDPTGSLLASCSDDWTAKVLSCFLYSISY